MGGVNKVTPGPGKYDIGSTLSTTRYSMRPKTQGDLMILNKFVPGPGTYPDMPSINKFGKYQLSKFGNSGATLFNPPRSKRFVEDKRKTLGLIIRQQGSTRTRQLQDGKHRNIKGTMIPPIPRMASTLSVTCTPRNAGVSLTR
jgi:hypothetical protein